MKIGDVCVREVVFTEATTSLQGVAELMRQHHVGSVLVVRRASGEHAGDKRKPVGIVTDRDLVIEVLAQKVDPDTVVVEDVMTRDLITAHEQQELWEVVSDMQERSVRRIPVIDDYGHLVGIFSIDDLLKIIASELSGIVKLITHERRKEAESRR